MLAGRLDGIAQQHGHGERADAAGDGRDRGGYGRDGFKIDVADRSPAAVLADADVRRLCKRLLNGAKWLPEVLAGVRFIDGEKPEKDAA